jgi:hypothetical protein
MYIYDKQFTGPQDRREEQPLILQPTDRYHHHHPTPDIRGGSSEGLGQPMLPSRYGTPCIHDDSSKWLDFAVLNKIIPKILNEFNFRDPNLRTWHKTWIKLQFVPAINASWNTSNPIRRIILVGHTDEVGKQSDNYQLGKARANAVAEEIKKESAQTSAARSNLRHFLQANASPKFGHIRRTREAG